MDTNPDNIARRLIELYAGADYPPEVEQEFRQWLVSGLRQEEKQEVLWELWNSLEPRPEAGGRRTLRNIKRELGLGAKFPVRRVWLGVAAVVAVLLMIPVGRGWLEKTVIQDQQQTATVLHAGEHEKKHAAITEAARVWLNSSSEVVYRDVTEVEVDGEAFFDVKKDQGASFAVKGGGLRAIVTGTSFNYRSYDDERTTVITLYEGSLDIESPDTSLVLRAGFELIYDRTDKSVVLRPISRQGPEWMREIINFESESVEGIFRALENIYGVTISFSGSGGTSDEIELKFEGGIELEEVLYFMSSITGTFDYEIDGDKVLIYWII